MPASTNLKHASGATVLAAINMRLGLNVTVVMVAVPCRFFNRLESVRLAADRDMIPNTPLRYVLCRGVGCVNVQPLNR